MDIQNKNLSKLTEKIEITENIEDLSHFKCALCIKTFSNKSNLNAHLNKCYNNLNKINEFFLENNEIIKEKLSDSDRKNYALNEVNKILDADRKCVHDIAKQPKNISNSVNNSIVNLLTPMDFSNKENIKSIINDKYNIDYIFSGQKGCAQFAYDNIIRDNDGNLKYICTDIGRSIYKYKDEDGNIQRDVDAKKLTKLLVEGGLKHKVIDLASNWWCDENGKVNSSRFEILLEKTQAIGNIEDVNNEFRKELTSMII